MQLGMKARTGASAVCAAAVFAAMAACSTSTGTTAAAVSDAQINTDLAAAAGIAASTQSGDFATQDAEAGAEGFIVGLRGGSAALGLGMKRATVESACTTGSFSGTIVFPFADPRDTISISRTWEFFAVGVCENAYVAGTTDSIVFAATVSSELHGKRGFWQAHHDDQRSNWVTGSLALSTASTHVWNGFEAGVDTSSFSGDIPESRTYNAASSDTVGSVTFPHPRDGAVYPSSGTYTRWVNAMATFSGPRTGSKQVARHIVVTFNGTEFVPIAIFDVGTGQVSLTCQLDLAIGEIVAGSCTD